MQSPHRPILALTLAAGLMAGCGGNTLVTAPNTSRGPARDAESAQQRGGVPAPTPSTVGNPNGRAGAMPAYYDGELFTINFMELSDEAAQALLAHNRSLNLIFMSDAGLPGGEPFVSVIDAIQGDGFNPLWQEVQISFTPGHTPRQLTSDDEIGDAVANGEIALSLTDEVYRCSVIGSGPTTTGRIPD